MTSTVRVNTFIGVMFVMFQTLYVEAGKHEEREKEHENVLQELRSKEQQIDMLAQVNYAHSTVTFHILFLSKCFPDVFFFLPFSTPKYRLKMTAR